MSRQRPPKGNTAGTWPRLPSTPTVAEDGKTLAWDDATQAFEWATGGGGGGGAPTTADYLVKTADAGLSAERVVTDTSWISVDWGTPGQAKFNLADAGLVSLAGQDGAAGLPYVSGANTWASLALATDKGIYATSTTALATYDLTSFARTLLDDTTAAAARTTLGIGTAGRGVVATAQAITPGSTYEIVTRQGARYLRVKRSTDFPTNRSVALASPEYGWSWLNRSALDSANENNVTANALRLDHGNTSTDWTTGGTQTGPARYRTYPLPEGRTYVCTAKIATNADQTFEYLLLQCWSTTSPGSFGRIGVGYQGAGGPHVGASIAGSIVTAAITTGQRDAGVWVRMIVSRERFDLAYSTAGGTTPPTSWTYLTTGGGPGPSNWAAGGLAVNIGLVMITVNTSNTLTADVLYYDVQAVDDTDAFTDSMSGLLWAAAQFDSTGAAQLIVDDLDLGSDAPSVDNTRLRAILADLENRLSGDSATITWSYKTSASTGATSGTFRAAGSVVDDGSGGRYLRLWAKITSDGNTQGSIGPFPFFIPTS